MPHRRSFAIALLCLLSSLRISGQITTASLADPPFMDAGRPLQERVDDLVSRMTLPEKISQMTHEAPAIPRLGIPAWNWWNECLHGVARNGIATVFPQAIGMAATWNPALIGREADVISTEARAKHAEALQKGESGIYQGLTFWSPNINIFRDPRWGRGQETYGEDPFLTATIGKAFVQGLQGSDPRWFKVIATAKHFAVHSGPEPDRHRFDAWPSERDLYDTYLPAFEALVREAGVYSVMGAYNRLYATPACASGFLLDDLLRKSWGFRGYVVSDCWAISDYYNFHDYVASAEKAAALSVKAGTDLSCGPEYHELNRAVNEGYLSENDIDQSVKRLMEARLRLGMFDREGKNPYAKIPPEQNNRPEHDRLALEVARQSIVLLKNDRGVLPLKKSWKTITVTGPYAEDTTVLLGNYHGTPSAPVTMLKGIRDRMGRERKVIYFKGVDTPDKVAALALKDPRGAEKQMASGYREAVEAAQKSDAVIFFGGISPLLEGEDLKVHVEGFLGGDRTRLDLPEEQTRLLQALQATGKPVILVLTSGSALSVTWEADNLPAIVEAWYPGQQGGTAVAEVLSGEVNPGGRLPVTFYASTEDLPAFDNYSMSGRTYRYFGGKPLYPFGFGLSYTTFAYSGFKATLIGGAEPLVRCSVTVTNTGDRSGDEVVQVYFRQPLEVKDQPLRSLAGFRRISLKAGETDTVEIDVPVRQLRHFDPRQGGYAVAKGNYLFEIGASSADIRFAAEVMVP